MASAPAAAEAADPVPPDLGTAIVDDPLTAPSIFPVGNCPTGQAGGDVVGEGYIIKVRGRCRATDSVAEGAVRTRGLIFEDGDVALDVKVAQGNQRTGFNIFVRVREGSHVSAYLNPAAGFASLSMLQGGVATVLAENLTVEMAADPDAWNRVALRASGSNAWLLVNDEPVLFAPGVLTEFGEVGIRVLREGDLNDAAESAVVFRNLAVSALDNGDPDRAPRYAPVAPVTRP